MKIFSFLLFITIFLFGSLLAKATIINEEISKKYSQIFSQNILNNADIDNYQKIFEYQESCKWKKANKYIFKIENNILIGHVLAQRYLHPKCYHSKYLELYSWLKKYNDHPQARRIYRLAVRRMPQGYKSLNIKEPIPTMAMYHPAFLLRSPGHKKEAWEDLQKIQKKITTMSNENI